MEQRGSCYLYDYKTSGSYLVHYGVPGQRWGIRRYQNEDGSLTDEGMRRYGIVGENGKLQVSDKLKYEYRNQRAEDTQYRNDIKREKAANKPIGKRRQELINDYKSRGLTQEQAEVEALRRERTEKIIKVAAAVAVTAAVAYGAYKGHQWLNKNLDKKIKAGTELLRTTGTRDGDMNRAGYLVDNRVDADKYAGAYGSQIKQNKAYEKLEKILGGEDTSNFDNNVYQKTGKAAKDIKIAGDRQAKKVYESLMKNDPQFRADNEVVKKGWANLPVVNGQGDSYVDFNTRLVDHSTEEANRVQKKFYDALKAKGYGGVIDINDRDFSGYHAKKPMIVFNMKEAMGETTVRTISDQEIIKKAAEAQELMANQMIKDMKVDEAMKTMRKWSGYGAVGSGIGLFAVKGNDRKNIHRGAYQKSIIKQYKKEHPNTRLTDSQILENELGA